MNIVIDNEGLGAKIVKEPLSYGYKITHRSSHILLQIRAKGFSMALLFHTDAQREKGVKKRIREKERESVFTCCKSLYLI